MVFIILEVIYADKVDDFHTCCHDGSDFCVSEEENVPKYGELAEIFRICSLSILSLISDISFCQGFDEQFQMGSAGICDIVYDIDSMF